MGLCKGTIIGNLGRDPETRYTPEGLAVTNFSVAATEKIKGEPVTQWVRATAFGKLAEICGEYLVKGKQVYLEGRISLNEWQDKEGNNRSNLELIVQTMQMIGAAPGNSNQQAARPQEQPASSGEYDGDLPF